MDQMQAQPIIKWSQLKGIVLVIQKAGTGGSEVKLAPYQSTELVIRKFCKCKSPVEFALLHVFVFGTGSSQGEVN